MNKITKAGLLSLIAITQTLTLVGGFFAYEQMSERLTRLQMAYIALYEETHPDHPQILGLDPPNPFAPLVPLVLFGLFLTVVLLVDQVRHKNAENRDVREK